MLNVAWVNTDQKPTKIERLGLFQIDEGKLSELCRVFYPHPEASDHATISVLNFERIDVDPEMIPSFDFIIKAMKPLSKISVLDNVEGVPVSIERV